ncbi:MAG: iron ABC transporter permease [Henriciella sp.]|nr:iron ABC transporter permease [Henriciella sp.]
MLTAIWDTGRTARSVALPIIIVLFVSLPVILAIWFGATAGGSSAWDHIVQNRLAPYTFTTLSTLLLTALLILIIAVPSAWIVSMYEFSGRRIFEWALILPLAMPGYVMAYAWADFVGVSGPLQSTIREITGMGARDYWFPNIYSVPGLAFILATTLFPYVYITARAAFTTQSLATLEVAKSLGSSGIALFWRVARPAAQPAIIGGLALALMEAAADYGAADYLGIQTLGVGIIRAWSSFGEPATAARLALTLITIAFLFLICARFLQGKSGTQQTSVRWLTPSRTILTGTAAATPIIWCSMIVLLAFILPVGRLVWLFLETGPGAASIWPPLQSSIILGGAGALAAFICSLTYVLMTRHSQTLRMFSRLSASAGYAAPGVVLGLGALLLLKTTGFPLSGALALGLLIWVYASRFTAAGVEPLQAALDKAPKSLDLATRSLGSKGLDRLFRVDLPLIAPGAFAASLILFVEAIKELPATLMLRPFGWDTLSVRAHAYATDERLAEATLPSLLIVLAGLAPVLLLSWRLSQSQRTSS